MPRSASKPDFPSDLLVADRDSRASGHRRVPVVLLVSHGVLANIVVNGLVERLGPLVVIREAPEGKLEVLRRRARLLGWTEALGQLGFGLFQRLMITGKSRNQAIWETYGLNPCATPAATVIDVPSVNAPECHALLQHLSPRVVGVYGTRILKAKTLKAVAAPFINYHAGINPKYRGQHPGYWALASGDPENAGVTVHLVDQGVDTGDVLYQAQVPFDANDSIATYQHLQAAYALPLFARALQDGLENTLRPKRVSLPSRQWFPPTLWRYLMTGLTQKVW